MKVSVVLSTYNGENYLIPLLDSLRLQSRRPDEVLIRDDCSKDSTAKIIEDYISKWSLNNWKLSINKKNLGWMSNFYNGIIAASGDYIFPCDQDDIWDKNKIKEMLQVMENNSCIRLLCCDYETFYMDGARKYEKTRTSKIKDDGTIERIDFKRGFLFVDRPGCTYCIKKELVPFMNQMYFNGYPHDALAWRAAVLNDGLFIYHKQLIRFRRHSNNASTSASVINAKGFLSSRLNTAEYYESFIGKALEISINDLKKRKYLEKCEQTAVKRVEYLNDKSLSKCFLALTHIHYYPTKTSYFGDLLSIIRS